MIQLLEIIRRSDQGVTRPFLCRADDGHLYYAKGAGAGARALIAEWIAGNLGLNLGLPVPPIAQAEVPPALLRQSASEEIGDLGEGPVFVSRAIAMAEELRFEQVKKVPLCEQAWTLLFDCWVINGDRTLSELGGNPNVLWTPSDDKMHLIDHNLAFGNDSVSDIKIHHVFGGSRVIWDTLFKQEAARRMHLAMTGLSELWESIPEEWLEYADLRLEGVQELLWRFDQPGNILWT